MKIHTSSLRPERFVRADTRAVGKDEGGGREVHEATVLQRMRVIRAGILEAPGTVAKIAELRAAPREALDVNAMKALKREARAHLDSLNAVFDYITKRFGVSKVNSIQVPESVRVLYNNWSDEWERADAEADISNGT
jgi:hypothetical protein